MNRKNGFTLLELLIVLSILSILLLIIVPPSMKSLEIQREKQFIKTLEFDILYVQALATTTSENVRIQFLGDKYNILKGNVAGSSIIKSREIPPDWDVNVLATRDISFYNSGVIKRPGKMKITTKFTTYEITFPFGKGRGYVKKK